MLVKAKWNVKDAAGWHEAGEVFQTESDLGDAVEVLDAPKKKPSEKQAPVKEPEPEAKARETEKEPETAAEAPMSIPRRKKVN